MNRRELAVRVECYAGYRDEETPRRLALHGRVMEVADILDRWLAPDHRYFKVRGADGSLYILRHDTVSGEWELTLFESGGPARGTPA
jgi:hypothetical protein